MLPLFRAELYCSEAELSEEETNMVSLVALGSRVIVPTSRLLIIIFNISLAKFSSDSPK